MDKPVNPETSDLPVDVDAALRLTLTDVLEGDHVVATGATRGASREKLHYTTGMSNPLARIGANPARQLNLVGAVARFVWMVGASDRLEDIAYYEPKVREFSDNDISVPGSSYGRRIFESSAGLNQISGAVKRLRDDATSRRSAVVVWDPNDAVRESLDIPCTFGFFYHVREEQLIASTIMRSNNAYILLPYNFFEFSLLAEVVAAAVEVRLGRYVHWAASMHVYEPMVDQATVVVNGPCVSSVEMPPIPHSKDTDPSYVLQQVRRLAVLEPQLRNASTKDEFLAVVESSRTNGGDLWLNGYWRALLDVLAAWGAAKRGWWDIADQRLNALPDYFQSVCATIENAVPRPNHLTRAEFEPDDQATLFSLSEGLPFSGTHQRVYAAGAAESSPTAFQTRVEAMCLEWAHRHEDVVSLEEMREVRSHAQSAYDLAARSQSGGGSSDDRADLDDELISSLILKVRRRPSEK